MRRLAVALVGASALLCLTYNLQPFASAEQEVLAPASGDTSESQLTSASVSTSSSVAAESTDVAGTVTAASKYGWGSVIAGDNFEYTGSPKSTKWSVYNSDGHGGHGRRSPSAWVVADGVATVTGNSTGTTGGMSARFGQKYGRWETRMKTNYRDSEYHPALLLWPDEPARATCPEIDYAESTHDTSKMKFFLHYGCEPKQTYAVRSIDTTQWHNYAVEWTPTHVTGFIDGVQWFSDTNTGHLPKVSMHQTIQLDWFPDGSTTNKSTMSIAWVRVYDLG
jgi:hypothetical protein